MKKILLMLVAVVALTACQKSAPTPTGDAQKDANALTEYFLEKIQSCKTEDDLSKIDAEMKEASKTFEEYAKQHPEYQKAFEDAGLENGQKLMNAVVEVGTNIANNKESK